MEEFFVYILYSESFDKYYVGQTEDLEERLWQRNNLDVNSFTSKYRPWKLAASFKFVSRTKALKAERFIKKQKNRKFLQKLIENQDNGDFIAVIFGDC